MTRPSFRAKTYLAAVLWAVFLQIFPVEESVAIWQSYFGAVNVTTLTVTGSTTITTLTASGAASMAAVSVTSLIDSGIASISGAFTTVGSSATINGALGVTGASSLAATSVSSNLTLGDSAQANMPGLQYVYAKSIDGTTEAAGCAGVINYQGQNSALVPVWTSTSAVPSTIGLIGITTASCVPGAVCPIQVRGVARVTVTATVAAPTQAILANTRCQMVNAASPLAGEAYAVMLTSMTTSQPTWVYLQ